MTRRFSAANVASLDGPGARKAGLAYAITAYALWGLLPVYFLLLAPSGPFEIVAMRIVFSLVFCAFLILVTRSWQRFRALVTDPRVLWVMGLAGVLIYINWQVYVIAAVSGHVVEAALGYFILPVVTVFLGVIFLQERLRATQWVSVGISIIAVIVLAVGYGQVPWISLALAFSFGFYGLIKKRVGPRVDAISGLTLETLWLTPVAIVQLVVVAVMGGLTIGAAGAGHVVLLMLAGVVTAVPLLLFASASRRLPLIFLGFIQYFAPTLQLVIGVVLLGEPMPPERWAGFALVWAALAILTVDMIRHSRGTKGRSRS